MKLKDFEKILKDLFLNLETYKNEYISQIKIIDNLDNVLHQQKSIKINIIITHNNKDNNNIIIMFKLPENLDNIYKSAINTIISKINNYYKIESDFILNNFGLGYVLNNYPNSYCKESNKLILFDKPKFLENFKNKNNSYFNEGLLYATNYGIGYFCIYMNKNLFENINNQISKHLEALKIGFKNEFSKAFWVYRFKIAGNDKISNIQILKNININL